MLWLLRFTNKSHTASLSQTCVAFLQAGQAGRANLDRDWLPRTADLRSATARDTVVTLDNLAGPRIPNAIIVGAMCIRAAPKRGLASGGAVAW